MMLEEVLLMVKIETIQILRIFIYLMLINQLLFMLIRGEQIQPKLIIILQMFKILIYLKLLKVILEDLVQELQQIQIISLHH